MRLASGLSEYDLIYFVSWQFCVSDGCRAEVDSRSISRLEDECPRKAVSLVGLDQLILQATFDKTRIRQ